MGSITWNNNKVTEFNDNDREYFINYFNSMRVKYIVDNENIIIFPALFDKTLILKSITNNKEEIELIKSIKSALINQGATVILGEDLTDKASLEYLDAQIFIVLCFGEKERDITVYIPFDANKTSTLVTKQLLKRLILLQKKITYKIANTWSKLKETKYWTYLFGNSIPLLVVEISNSALSEDFLRSFEDVLVRSIIDELGNKPSNEEVEELVPKLKFYKNKLEEELQRVNNDKENISIEESENIETENIETEDTKEKEFTLDCQQEQNQTESTNIEIEEELQRINNDKENMSKTKINEKKNIKSQSKKMYLPNMSGTNINQGDLNQQLAQIMMYPGEGPVYKFERRKPDTESVELPPELIK